MIQKTIFLCQKGSRFTYESADQKRDDLNNQNDRDDNGDLSIRKIFDDGAGHFLI